MLAALKWLLSLSVIIVCFASSPGSTDLIASHGLDPSLAIVGTIDGVLHAIDMNEGRVLWSFDSGSPLVSCANHQSVEKLIPSSLDGSLYSFDR
jgi:outer membrane protein assembly factor BamB